MNFISVLRTEMKLISVVWSYGIVISKLFHRKIKFISGEIKPPVNSLLQKLGYPEAEVECQSNNF